MLTKGQILWMIGNQRVHEVLSFFLVRFGMKCSSIKKEDQNDHLIRNEFIAFHEIRGDFGSSAFPSADVWNPARYPWVI